MSSVLDFIQNSVSFFHSIEQSVKKLKSMGFSQLHEDQPFKITKGKKYFVVRNDSAVIAFTVPNVASIKKSHILISHGDSPTFRIKPNGEFVEKETLYWGLEVYGGPIYATWLNRSLGFAGRVHYEHNGELVSKIVQFDQYPITVAQLPIHLERTVNKEGLKIDAQKHLNAIVGLSTKGGKKSTLETLLEKKLKTKKVLNHELYVYPLEQPRFIGDQKDLFIAPRIDNLASASASLDALMKGSQKKANSLNIVYIASHEEVGSRTISGADSPFFQSVWNRLFHALGHDLESIEQCKASSMAFSIDGSHALDPQNQDRFEPRHTPLLGKGVTVKVDASACYAYDASIIAKLKALESKGKVKIQTYLKKGDERQGSTVGPLFAKNMGIKTLDIGLSQLSMHSCYEVASCRDYDQLVKLLGLILNDQL